MDLLEEANAILEAAGYRTVRPGRSAERFYFEDSSLLGFVSVFPSVDQLLKDWEGLQDSFLSAHAKPLRLAPGKAWNAYSILLTQAVCSARQLPLVLGIEEDFRGTRKIARASIATRPDLIRALFPLLPIHHLVTLGREDAAGRLQARPELAGEILTALLADVSVGDTVRVLLEEPCDSLF